MFTLGHHIVAPRPTGRPSVPSRMLLAWSVAYPAITFLQVIGEPVLSGLALPLRTLVLTAVLVPGMVLIVPRLQKIVGLASRSGRTNRAETTSTGREAE
jgi:antibiotic biosynthesis monooxygenase (ABM) superfamily enzyme